MRRLFCSLLVSGLIPWLLCCQNGNDIQSLELKLSRNDRDVPTLIALGKIYHSMARSKNDSVAVGKAESYLKKAVDIDGRNGEALVWYGSIMTVKGSHAEAPWDKVKFVDKGLSLMDQGVRVQPESLNVRLVRANNNVSLPLLFNRIDTAVTDYTFMINKMGHTRSPRTVAMLPTLYMGLAKCCQLKEQTEKSIEIWKTVVAKYPGSESAREAERNLAKYRGK